MRTTLALDDELLAKAQALTGMTEKSALVKEALRALIQRESARRLALLGGSEPQLTDIPRRRPEHPSRRRSRQPRRTPRPFSRSSATIRSFIRHSQADTKIPAVRPSMTATVISPRRSNAPRT